MRRLVSGIAALLLSLELLGASSWDTAFSLLDQLEVNVSELKNSATEMQLSNNDLQTIIVGQEQLLMEWQSIWNDSYNLLQTQQTSLERCERSLQVFKTTTIVLGVTTVLSIAAAVIVGYVK